MAEENARVVRLIKAGEPSVGVHSSGEVKRCGAPFRFGWTDSLRSAVLFSMRFDSLGANWMGMLPEYHLRRRLKLQRVEVSEALAGSLRSPYRFGFLVLERADQGAAMVKRASLRSALFSFKPYAAFSATPKMYYVQLAEITGNTRWQLSTLL
jgi:hypothetical protein